MYSENPADGEMEGSNTTLAWIEFLRANGIEHAYATGSIAEVLADVNDRVSGQTQQLANSVGWSKDLIREMQLQQDSMRLEVGARLDSLERNFTAHRGRRGAPARNFGQGAGGAEQAGYAADIYDELQRR